MLFNEIGKAIRDAADKWRGLGSRIEDRKRELQRLETLPLPQTDVATLVAELVDAEAARFPMALRNALVNFHKIDSRPIFETANWIPALITTNPSISSAGVGQAAICAIAPEGVKKALRDAVMTWDWPKEVGPPRAARLQRMEQLRKEIVELEKQQAALREEASANGVNLAAQVGERGGKYLGGRPGGEGKEKAKANA